MTAKSINREVEGATSLNAFRLIEIYKEGQLKDGKLKEIASKLDAEDNPVIMLVKQKKSTHENFILSIRYSFMLLIM